MKEKILEKIARRLSQLGMSQTSEQAYNDLSCAYGANFSDLCAIYRLTDEECDYICFPE